METIQAKSKICFFTVTRRLDWDFFKKCISSFERFCKNPTLPYCVVVPDQELAFFEAQLSEFKSTLHNLVILGESHLLHGSNWLEHNTGFRDGYILQQIIKLRSYKLGIAHSYVVVDSDTLFIRDFDASDFLDTKGEPFSILTEDRELLCEKHYEDFQIPRLRKIHEIYSTVGIHPKPYLQVQMNPILQTHVLEHMEANLGISHADMMRIGPYEYSWYSAWMMKNFPTNIIQSEPWVKTVHTPQQHLLELMRGGNVENYSKGYLAVIYNSSWLRQWKTSFLYRAYQISLFLFQTMVRTFDSGRIFRKLVS